MKKSFHFKALALLLCLMLILTLIPVGVSAAASFGVIEIPVFKTVTAPEGIDPGKAEFEFEVSGFLGFGEDGPVYGGTIETDGVGTFNTTIQIPVATVNDFYNLTEGFSIKEKDGGADGWTYDKTEWFVLPYFAENPLAGTTPTASDIRVAFYNTTAGEEPDYGNPQLLHRTVEFKNEYMEPGTTTTTTATTGDGNNTPALTIDFTKTVEVETAGVTAPAKEFNLVINGVSDVVLADLETDGFNIPTKGEGEYKGTIRLIPKNDVVYEGMGNGFWLQEDNDGDADWDFDDTIYRIIPNYNATGGVDYEIYKEELTEGAVAAELTPVKRVEFTNTYKGDGTTDKDNDGDDLTITIPLVKTVVQGGDKKPDVQKFSFGISDFKVSEDRFTVSGTDISVNGKGKFESEIIIKAKDGDAYAALQQGFKIYEIQPVDTGDWEYDETVWVAEAGLDDEGNTVFNFYVDSENANKELSDKVEFTNTYTAFDGGATTPSKGPDDPGTSGGKVKLTYDANGGSVYDAVEEYEKGTKVDLTKTATRDGFTFLGWYDDAEGTTKLESVTLDADTTVYAAWKQTPVPEILDSTDHSAYVIGYEDGTVRPTNNITRAEVTMIFYRLLKEEVRNEYKSTTNAFEDVAADAWYNEAVSTMANIGIIKGRSATSFAPNAPITRAEYATICARFDESVAVGSSDFTDISGHWAESYIERAVILGWVKGYEDKTFRPDKEITRAEAMTLTNRVLQRIPDEIGDLLSGMRTFTDNSDPTVWYYIPVQEATNSHDYERKSNGHEKWTALK